MQNLSKFWDDYWRRNVALNPKKKLIVDNQNALLYQYLLRFIPKNALVLEAGCGDGSHVIALGNYGFRIVGLDLSFESIKCAVNNINANDSISRPFGNRATLINGDLLALPFKEDSLTCYLSFGVLEHFHSCKQRIIIQEARRVLCEGGIIIVTVPNRWTLWPLFRLFFSKIGTEYCWQKSMTKQALKKRFVELGFEPIMYNNFDVWTSLRRSLCLEKKFLKGFLFNPLFPFKKIFEITARLSEKYIPLIGYNSLFIGRKTI
jgi:SAM-dependent methyltransferase